MRQLAIERHRTTIDRPWSLLRRWTGEPLAAAEAERFADETAERDIRRLRVLAPIMAVLHATHILLYRTTDTDHARLADEVVRWQGYVVLNHAVMLPLSLLLTTLAYRRGHTGLGRYLGIVAATAYLLHGAAATGIDQIALDNVSAFTGYCFGIAVIVSPRLPLGVAMYGLAFATLAALVVELQVDPAVRLSNLLNAATVAAISVGLSAMIDAARRRDFSQRATIARQRDELATLNAELERRVDEQVAEIVRRAHEVDQLNAQLRSQVRARSAELSIALSKLARLREEESSLRAGSVLAERFDIESTIGSGGMGVVYAGRDRVTGSRVAIKVIRPSSAIEPDAMHRFVSEASTVASISHPAVVRVIHVDISSDGLLYQAQELVEGRTLEEMMDEGSWPAPHAARLAAVLSNALATAHASGVVHRDVKPANVMLIAKAPGLKLLDFGLAKLFDDASGDRTASRFVIGTPAYMAPEQVLGGEVSGKTDVYAAGMLLFQLLTGQRVFESDVASRVMLKHAAAEAPDVRTVRGDVDAALADLVAACLSKDPHERPTANELARRLTEFADANAAPALDVIVAQREAPAPAPDPIAGPAAGLIGRRMRG